MVPQLVDSAIDLVHLRLKTTQTVGRYTVVIRDPQQQAHCIACEVGEATSPGDRREPAQFIVFRIRQSDTDHPRTRLQYFHGPDG